MGFIYLIEDVNNNTFKIGVTKDLNKRIKKLQTGNSTQLKLKYSFEYEYPFRLESMLHTYYKEYCELNEWFALPSEKVNEFLNKCIDFSNIIEELKTNPFFSKGLK